MPYVIRAPAVFICKFSSMVLYCGMIIIVYLLRTCAYFSFNLSCSLHSKGGKFNSMKTIQCKKCSTNNTFGTKYCQHCGSPLTYRQSFTKMLAGLNFDALAGLGQKNVSLAPLFTANLLGTKKPDVKRGKRIQIAAIPLPDGKWFCPDCGWKNLPGSLFCDNCSRHI